MLIARLSNSSALFSRTIAENEAGPKYFEHVDVLYSGVSEGTLYVKFNFQVDSVTRGFFEYGGTKFYAKDGDWQIDGEWTDEIHRISAKRESYVEWPVPDGFSPESANWRINGLYDSKRVRIFKEGGA